MLRAAQATDRSRASDTSMWLAHTYIVVTGCVLQKEKMHGNAWQRRPGTSLYLGGMLRTITTSHAYTQKRVSWVNSAAGCSKTATKTVCEH